MPGWDLRCLGRVVHSPGHTPNYRLPPARHTQFNSAVASNLLSCSESEVSSRILSSTPARSDGALREPFDAKWRFRNASKDGVPLERTWDL